MGAPILQSEKLRLSQDHRTSEQQRPELSSYVLFLSQPPILGDRNVGQNALL